MFVERRTSYHVVVKEARHPDPGEMVLTEVMAALSDPIRVGLVRLLSDGQERGWGALRVPVSKSTLSHHLRVLRDAGLTRTRQEGTRCYVVLRSEDLHTRFPGLLDAVLAAADSEDVGSQVGLATDGSRVRQPRR
ncbi:metalloregulator ArsR/SmtB family transcription factor [Solwaraspora sp. WMMA2065]|uniref:ArsR/SmtB family transcription factor n=1 Tax=Solwaraspora sp. WMMA2065 TaxID=3015166 RepID=UPI00259B2508|nr:metalloregulator ArsR/SmtB family transcription factor [Solwaraspora sp. WMMA2065]WJK36302.1 metalloregulator ArsR/SmtB family transcription factor [Solwaraspora sp. WMMA2065]